MREYVVSVCFAILFCTGVFIVLPDKRYEGIVKIVCGIFVISTVASPIPGILKIGTEKFSFTDYLSDEIGFFEKAEESQKSYTEYMEKNLSDIASQKLKSEIFSVFGIDAQVKVDASSAEVVVEGIEEKYKENVKSYINTNYSLNTVFDN